MQPSFNLGTLGSVSSGKSTCIYSLTGILTQRTSSEKVRNMTIKPGYANIMIYGDDNNYSIDSKDNLPLKKYISFIDCPGHYELTKVVLGQVNMMSGAICIISAVEDIMNNKQLREHLNAAKLAGIKKIIVCLNKCDLLEKKEIINKKNKVDELFKIMGLKYLCIIPTSFTHNIGVDYLLKAIDMFFETPKYNNTTKPQFYISRSFDINRPGTNFMDLKGGVVGGSLIKGTLSVGDMVEIKPGIVGKVNGKIVSMPIKSKILSIKSEKKELKSITPGGLMAIRLDIDSQFTKNDRMIGNMMGLVNHLPEVYNNIKIKYKLFDKVLLEKNNTVNLQIGTLNLVGTITRINKLFINLDLERPCCLEKKTTIFINKITDKTLNIIGKGYLC